MFLISIAILLFTALCAIREGIVNTSKVIEFPFMLGGCLLVWIIPQAFLTNVNELGITDGMIAQFNIFAAICVWGALYAYNRGFKKKNQF